MVLCDYQREMEESENDEAEMSRPSMQVHNRQVTKIQRFTLYEKMAAKRKIQQNIEFGDLRKRAACTMANLYHAVLYPEKRYYTHAGEEKQEVQEYVSGAIINSACV